MIQEQQRWQYIAGTLLTRHFGLALNDTDLCEEICVMTLQESGIQPYEAINDLVDKYHLERIDTVGYQRLSPYLCETDELKVIQDAQEEAGHDGKNQ